MKKKLTIVLLSIALLLLLTSCPQPPEIMGDRVLMMGDHFMFDQTYDRGWQVWYLNSDGSYERFGQSWDETSGKYVQDWGTKGSYTYDKNACLLTIFPAQGLGWGDVADEYADIAALYTEDAPEIDDWTMTRTFNYYFTDYGMYEAYMAQPDGSWVFSEKYSSKETEDGTETEYYNDSTRSYTLSSSEFKYSELDVFKEREETVETNDSRHREEGKVRRTAPTDTEWKAGKTVTFFYGPETRVWEDWNDITEEWDITDDQSDAGETWSKTFVHLGDYMLKVDATSSKNLSIE